MEPWKQYQEDVAEFFRSIGLSASTDVTVKGARTKHDVDILVVSQHVGYEVTWVVECKYWKRPVNKLHVLGLREIVADIGADRGILLSESGFQSGAIEAANLTNIKVASLSEFKSNASENIYAMRLRDLFDRAGVCEDRFRALPLSYKRGKIQIYPRPEHSSHSADVSIDMCMDLLKLGLRGVFPFETQDLTVYFMYGDRKQFDSAEEIANLVEAELDALESAFDLIEKEEKEKYLKWEEKFQSK